MLPDQISIAAKTCQTIVQVLVKQQFLILRGQKTSPVFKGINTRRGYRSGLPVSQKTSPVLFVPREQQAGIQIRAFTSEPHQSHDASCQHHDLLCPVHGVAPVSQKNERYREENFLIIWLVS